MSEPPERPDGAARRASEASAKTQSAVSTMAPPAASRR